MLQAPSISPTADAGRLAPLKAQGGVWHTMPGRAMSHTFGSWHGLAAEVNSTLHVSQSCASQLNLPQH